MNAPLTINYILILYFVCVYSGWWNFHSILILSINELITLIYSKLSTTHYCQTFPFRSPSVLSSLFPNYLIILLNRYIPIYLLYISTFFQKNDLKSTNNQIESLSNASQAKLSKLLPTNTLIPFLPLTNDACPKQSLPFSTLSLQNHNNKFFLLSYLPPLPSHKTFSISVF